MTAKIKLNAASGGGSFSLQAPSSSSNNRVFTIPDVADGMIATTATAGKILQVVSAVKKDTASAAILRDTDWTGHGLSVTITPSSASNKIIIIGNFHVNLQYTEGIRYKLFKGGSVLTDAIGDQLGSNRVRTTGGVPQRNDNDYQAQAMPIHFVDTAGSTSALTYTPAFSGTRTGGTFTMYVNRSTSSNDNDGFSTAISTLMAMEVSV